MSTPFHTSKPTTPRRSMYSLTEALLRSPTSLLRSPTPVSRLKRPRSSPFPSPSNPKPPLPAVVLQTYSVSTDSIILTALPTMPFCCHEDLLTMSRGQLVGVVRALNEWLPRRMRIIAEDESGWDDEEDESDDRLSRMSEAEMRRKVEELVGIRTVVGKNRVSRSGLGLGTEVPPAPKAARTRDAIWRVPEQAPWEMDVDVSEGSATHDVEADVTDYIALGSSPLAMHSIRYSHPRGRGDTFSRLAILQEENESDGPIVDHGEDEAPRASKRRRISSGEEESEVYSVRTGRTSHPTFQGSRLIENMDTSATPLLGEDTISVSLATARPTTHPQSEETATSATPPDVTAHAPLQRRRSARIHQKALKRASSVESGKVTTNDNMSLGKSSLSRAKTYASRRFQAAANSQLSQKSTSEIVSSKPTELTIRLPFTSTPPHLKPAPPPAFAPRILRSHSQRLSAAFSPPRTPQGKVPLARSQSARLPSAQETAFVTINRPRYRFSRRKSKVASTAKGDKGALGLKPAQSVQVMVSSPRSTETVAEREDDGEKGNTGLQPATVSALALSSLPTATSGLLAFPSALASFLTPRARAPSTSTVASAQDVPVVELPPLLAANDSIALESETPGVNDGFAEGIWEALDRMDVDST